KGWLRDLQWEFNSNWGSTSYDTPDEEFHKNKYTVLTEKPQVYVMGRYPEGFGLMDSATIAIDKLMLLSAPRIAKFKAAPPSTKQSEDIIQVRSEFITTPLFNSSIKVDQSGVSRITFKAPDNIGTFVIKAIAVNKNHQFGASTTEIISRKKV